MAKETGTGSNEVLEGLAETIGTVLERKRAAAQKDPDIYASGMRGNELPPAKRKEAEAKAKADKEAAKKAGMRRGVTPTKAQNSQGRNKGLVEDDDEQEDGAGKKRVEFTAGPTKKKLLAENKRLKAELEKAKSKGKPKIKID